MSRENLLSLIKFFPETVVSVDSGKVVILNDSTLHLSEDVKGFLKLHALSPEQGKNLQYQNEDHFFKIKIVETSDLGLLFFISDFTEFYLKEKELEQSKHQLANSSKLAALGEMAGGVAHEINNPLQILSLSVEQMRLFLAAKSVNISECDKICDQIESTVDRVNNIVKGMKLISRDGNQDPFEKVDIRDVIKETFSFCKEKFKNNGVRLIFFEEELASHFILGQRVKLSQVVLNLLNNAFDAISKNKTKTIRVSIGQKDGQLVLSISDNGPGVPEELANKVFQPFFTTKEIGKGTGLGLSISKGIIEQHQGMFYLDENNRSKFMIEIPFYNQEEA